MIRTSFFRSGFALSLPVFLLLLSACGPILPQRDAAPRLFSLNSAPKAVPVYTALPFSLQIQAPQAVPALNTERIALKKGEYEMDYYAGAKWGGSLPTLVQSRMVDAFERSRALRAVASDSVPFKADYILSTDITDFQAEYPAMPAPAQEKRQNREGQHSAKAPVMEAPVVRIRVVTRLTHGPLFDIVSTNTLEETEKAAGNTMQDVIAASNRAFDRILSRVIGRTISDLPQPKPPARPKK